MKRVARALGLVIAVLGIIFVVREITENRAEVLAAAGGAEPMALGAALLIGLASMASIGLAWRRCLVELGARLSVRATLHRYFVGQLGKYVPGGIWPVVGRAEMARRGGVSATVAYSSTLLSLALTYLAAILTSAAALMSGAAGGSGVAWQPVVALLPVGVLALHPWTVERVLELLARMTNRDLAIPVPEWATSIKLLMVHVPAWLGVSAATWLVADALDPGSASLRNIVFATTLSWVVGFLAIGVPGGIGVREAVFVAAATSLSTSGVAAAVALVARFIFVLVDVGGAGLATLLAGGRRPFPSRSS